MTDSDDYSPIKSQIPPIIPSDFIRKVLLTIVAMCHYTFRLTAPTLITIGLAYTLIHVAVGYNEEQHRRPKTTEEGITKKAVILR